MEYPYDEVVEQICGWSDGKSRFYKVNPMISQCLSTVDNHKLSVIARYIVERSLSNPAKMGEDAPCQDGTESVKAGRWSDNITTENIIVNTMTPQEVYSNGQPKTWLRSRVSEYINVLLKLRVIFRFEIKIGKQKFQVYTYNRHILTVGLFWPEYWDSDIQDIRKGGKVDASFAPPIVPKTICSLSKDNSLLHCADRLTNAIYFSKYQAYPGWESRSSVFNKVKEKYCSEFLWNLIQEMAPSVRSEFKRYDQSGLCPNDYVKLVHTIASALPPFEGIDVDDDFISNLRIPVVYIEQIKKTMKEYVSDVAAVDEEVIMMDNFLDQSAGVAPDDEKTENSQGAGVAPEKHPLGAGVAPNTHSSGAGVAPETDDENEHNVMTMNELCEKSAPPHIEYDKKSNNREYEEKPEIDDQYEDGLPPEDTLQHIVCQKEPSVDVTYNGAMKNDVRVKLTMANAGALAFSNVEFTPPDMMPKNRYSRPSKTEPTDDSFDVYRKIEADGQKVERTKTLKENPPTVLDSARVFLKEFRRIFKKHVPNAKFQIDSFNSPDLGFATKAMDMLGKRGIHDPNVALAWMDYTARKNLRYRGLVGVRLMTTVWDDFAKTMPSPDVLRSKTKKPHPVSDGVSDSSQSSSNEGVVVKSMFMLFDSGFRKDAVINCCQFWGVAMTIAYIASKVGKDAATKHILICLDKCSPSQLGNIFSMTMKYDKCLSDPSEHEWEGSMQALLARAGKIEDYPISNIDKENVSLFFKRMKGGK